MSDLFMMSAKSAVNSQMWALYIEAIAGLVTLVVCVWQAFKANKSFRG